MSKGSYAEAQAPNKGVRAALLEDMKALPYPYILAQSAVPVGIAPNGTIATNGTVTLDTALMATFSKGIWLYFPAGAVAGDATGGFYWCVMSSTTVGVVYAGKGDPATEFIPYIGSTAGGAVTGSNSAYTQTAAADITLVNITVPANTMGANGSLRINFETFNNSSGNNKLFKVVFGGSTMVTRTRTTSTHDMATDRVRNNGEPGLQTYQILAEASSSSIGRAAFGIDTTTEVSLVFVAQLAVATDYVIWAAFAVEVLP